MKPENKSRRLLGVTRSKAKMIEYGVEERHQSIDLSLHLSKLFSLCIGILGDLVADINRNGFTSSQLQEHRSNLQFSAHFFDAYLNSGFQHELDAYFVLLSSSSYYLCDLPGSAAVIVKSMPEVCPDLAGAGLEYFLFCLLRGDYSSPLQLEDGYYSDYVNEFSKRFIDFYNNGIDEAWIRNLAKKLRKDVYSNGSPRQLLLCDCACAIIEKKIENSSWISLPSYTGLHVDKWSPIIRKDTFIKELWPAQHLLGADGVLNGESAVVQMPTSAGKTKATELIIRSAFLSERTKLVIVVAPFRALCHEIKNSFTEAFAGETVLVDEFTDAPQSDFEILLGLGSDQIIVITPEKFLFVLRHTPEFADRIGLIIFDEGHQFDSGSRGITYELLLSSLRTLLNPSAQKVLISAVISNAESIGESIPEQWQKAVLNCQPLSGGEGVHRPRPRCFWPVDVLELAEKLVNPVSDMAEK